MGVGRLGEILGRKIREIFDMIGEKKLATQGYGERDVN